MGSREAMEPSQSLWHNRRMQRSACFALFVLTLLVFALYSGRQWPSTARVHLDSLEIPYLPTADLLHSASVRPHDKAGEDPLYDGSVPEYDVKNMPKVPSNSRPPKSPVESSVIPLDSTRVALLIETRPLPVIPALLTQFISNLPRAWVVRFVGNADSFLAVKKSRSLARHIKSGKLVMTDLPAEYPTTNNEALSATLTNVTFYSKFLAPAEWILMFQTDSMICSASEQSLDDWVDMGYDWVGAPWNDESRGGNGGLSLRHVPPIIKVLKNETRPANASWEDRWLCDRLPNLAHPNISQTFSVESVYYPRPFGYHLRGSGKMVHGPIWLNSTRKRQIFKYCPETKIILGNMNLESASEVDDEKNENDPQGQALSDVFKTLATKMMDPASRPTLVSEKSQERKRGSKKDSREAMEADERANMKKRKRGRR